VTTVGREHGRAAFGFSVHTGWAALVAVCSEPPTSVVVLDRRRVEMIPGSDPESPPFVYHAARALKLDAAERLVQASAALSLAKAKAAIRSAAEELAAKGQDVVASGIVAGGRPPAASLEEILKSHSAVHAAEGELFRGAIRGASEALEIAVVEVRGKDLHARAAAILEISAAQLAQRLSRIGRAAGRPWAKDQKEACLAAWIALVRSGPETR
jgi:hypothetical protein